MPDTPAPTPPSPTPAPAAAPRHPLPRVPAFQPAAGLRAPHAQTLYAHFLRPRWLPPVSRQRWELPDGDFVDVDVLRARDDSQPRVLVLHGLEGSTRGSAYVASTIRHAAARGWGAVALNFRSCSGVDNRLPVSYNAGATQDPLWVLRKLREESRAPIVAIGFSLGANVLLKLLADEGDAAPVDAAVAVSAPFDLARCAAALDRWDSLTAAYRLRFVFGLRRKAAAKNARHPGRIDLERIRRTLSLRDFDDAVTAPLHGYTGAADYYARASAGAAAIARIRRPTLLVSAADDPMVPEASFPREAAAHNPFVVAALSRHGGHVGFVSGSVRAPHFWAEETAIAWLHAVI
jgi:predicted alpha/beta-fold hydrolase